MNDNGEQFTDFCAFSNLVIGGSVFPHKRVHKVTWVSLDHKSRTNKKRGADAAIDHLLPIRTLHLKLKKFINTVIKVSTRYNVSLLQDQNIREQFQISISNRFHRLVQLEDQIQTVDQNQEKMKRAWIEACEDM